MPVAAEITKTVEVPDGVKVTYTKDNGELVITGPNGSLTRTFVNPRLIIEYKKDTISVSCNRPRKRDNSMLGTWTAHIQNMVRGVTEGFEYKMKIVYSHFPIKTHVKDDQLIIENFLGEKQPRYSKIVGDTKVKVSGDQIIINGIDLEAAGQSMANIERATKIKDYDPRVFQDGIYLEVHPKK
jgi:large subunit ribosomal protein L6